MCMIPINIHLLARIGPKPQLTDCACNILNGIELSQIVVVQVVAVQVVAAIILYLPLDAQTPFFNARIRFRCRFPHQVLTPKMSTRRRTGGCFGFCKRKTDWRIAGAGVQKPFVVDEKRATLFAPRWEGPPTRYRANAARMVAITAHLMAYAVYSGTCQSCSVRIHDCLVPSLGGLLFWLRLFGDKRTRSGERKSEDGIARKACLDGFVVNERRIGGCGGGCPWFRDEAVTGCHYLQSTCKWCRTRSAWRSSPLASLPLYFDYFPVLKSIATHLKQNQSAAIALQCAVSYVRPPNRFGLRALLYTPCLKHHLYLMANGTLKDTTWAALRISNQTSKKKFISMLALDSNQFRWKVQVSVRILHQVLDRSMMRFLRWCRLLTLGAPNMIRQCGPYGLLLGGRKSRLFGTSGRALASVPGPPAGRCKSGVPGHPGNADGRCCSGKLLGWGPEVVVVNVWPRAAWCLCITSGADPKARMCGGSIVRAASNCAGREPVASRKYHIVRAASRKSLSDPGKRGRVYSLLTGNWSRGPECIKLLSGCHILILISWPGPPSSSPPNSNAELSRGIGIAFFEHVLSADCADSYPQRPELVDPRALSSVWSTLCIISASSARLASRPAVGPGSSTLDDIRSASRADLLPFEPAPQARKMKHVPTWELLRSHPFRHRGASRRGLAVLGSWGLIRSHFFPAYYADIFWSNIFLSGIGITCVHISRGRPVLSEAVKYKQDEEKCKVDDKFEEIRGQIQIEHVSTFVLPTFDLDLVLVHSCLYPFPFDFFDALPLLFTDDSNFDQIDGVPDRRADTGNGQDGKLESKHDHHVRPGHSHDLLDHIFEHGQSLGFRGGCCSNGHCQTCFGDGEPGFLVQLFDLDRPKASVEEFLESDEEGAGDDKEEIGQDHQVGRGLRQVDRGRVEVRALCQSFEDDPGGQGGRSLQAMDTSVHLIRILAGIVAGKLIVQTAAISLPMEEKQRSSKRESVAIYGRALNSQSTKTPCAVVFLIVQSGREYGQSTTRACDLRLSSQYVCVSTCISSHLPVSKHGHRSPLGFWDPFLSEEPRVFFSQGQLRGRRSRSAILPSCQSRAL
ncbi:hypothetical protein KCU88_g144, partial [Aureobasidium melanogenum]